MSTCAERLRHETWRRADGVNPNRRRVSTLLHTSFNHGTGSRPVRIGFQVEEVRLEQDLLEELVEARLLLG